MRRRPGETLEEYRARDRLAARAKWERAHPGARPYKPRTGPPMTREEYLAMRRAKYYATHPGSGPRRPPSGMSRTEYYRAWSAEHPRTEAQRERDRIRARARHRARYVPHPRPRLTDDERRRRKAEQARRWYAMHPDYRERMRLQYWAGSDDQLRAVAATLVMLRDELAARGQPVVGGAGRFLPGAASRLDLSGPSLPEGAGTCPK